MQLLGIYGSSLKKQFNILGNVLIFLWDIQIDINLMSVCLLQSCSQDGVNLALTGLWGFLRFPWSWGLTLSLSCYRTDVCVCLLADFLLRPRSVHLLPPRLWPAQRPGAHHEDHGSTGPDLWALSASHPLYMKQFQSQFLLYCGVTSLSACSSVWSSAVPAVSRMCS